MFWKTHSSHNCGVYLHLSLDRSKFIDQGVIVVVVVVVAAAAAAAVAVLTKKQVELATAIAVASVSARTQRKGNQVAIHHQPTKLLAWSHRRRKVY